MNHMNTTKYVEHITLYHPGIQNSSYANLEIKKQNISEYLKICAFTPIQLKQNIHGWAK